MAQSKKKCPLWQRSDGRWCKKIKGQFHYFGKDKEAALAQWEDEKEDLLAGRPPRRSSGSLTVKQGINLYLEARQSDVATNDLEFISWDGYKRAGARMMKALGPNTPIEMLTPEDFGRLRKELGDGYAASTLGLAVRRVRIIFNWLVNSKEIPQQPDYGLMFAGPSAKRRKREKAAAPDRSFKPDQVRWMIRHSRPHMKAFVLLGINAAYMPSDIGFLTRDKIDLDTGWLTQPRHKTGEERRCKLWPETVTAIKAAVALQKAEPASPKLRDRVFLTAHGNSWEDRNESTSRVTEYFRDQILKPSSFYRKGQGLGSLRHTFRTVADETLQWPAINLIMGHADPTMGGVYRQHVADERLILVTDYVYKWLALPKRKSL